MSVSLSTEIHRRTILDGAHTELPFSSFFPKILNETEKKVLEVANAFFCDQESLALELMKEVPQNVRHQIYGHFYRCTGQEGRRIWIENAATPQLKAMILADFISSNITEERNALIENFKSIGDWSKSISYEEVSRIGRMEENAPINQWNIVPYDATRVTLASGKYINANTFRSKYILTQGPVSKEDIGKTDSPIDTAPLFWEMVQEKNAHTIVMLNGEEGEYYYPYFPHNVGDVKRFGGSTIICIGHETHRMEKLGMTPFPSVSDRTLLIKTPEGDTKTIHHIKANQWHDFTPGDEKTILKIVELVKKYQQSENTLSPMVVHCRAGVGRTGQFVVVMELEEAAGKGIEYDVEKVVRDLRDPEKGRSPYMIQGEQQFLMAHRVLRNIASA